MVKPEHVTKHFGAGKSCCNLSLQIRQGELFGLPGPDGAGKTTTINIGIGALAPDSVP
jgi:ABC-2 type transport system ATP-binding protein